MNVIASIRAIDLALTLCANQFAGRSIALDKFVNHIAYLPLLNGGVFLAAFFWLWFEADENYFVCPAPQRCRFTSGGHRHRRCLAPSERLFAIALSPAALP